MHLRNVVTLAKVVPGHDLNQSRFHGQHLLPTNGDLLFADEDPVLGVEVREEPWRDGYTELSVRPHYKCPGQLTSHVRSVTKIRNELVIPYGCHRSRDDAVATIRRPRIPRESTIQPSVGNSKPIGILNVRQRGDLLIRQQIFDCIPIHAVTDKGANNGSIIVVGLRRVRAVVTQDASDLSSVALGPVGKVKGYEHGEIECLCRFIGVGQLKGRIIIYARRSTVESEAIDANVLGLGDVDFPVFD